MNTTDDLRARLLAAGKRVEEMIRLRETRSPAIVDMREWASVMHEAIAALSALPAGGEVGVVRWAANIPNTIIEVLWRDGIAPPVGTKLYTTQALPGGEPVAWQARFKRSDGRWSDWAHAPSEGEAKEFVREHSAGGGVAECRALYTTPPPDAAVGDYESWAKQERQREDAKARLGVAVGAQGEDELEMLRAANARLQNMLDQATTTINGLTAAVEAIATPAAGKGVDEAMVERALSAVVGTSVFTYRVRDFITPSANFSVGDVMRAALEAPLTRQPVEDDCLSLIPWAEYWWREGRIDVSHDFDTFQLAEQWATACIAAGGRQPVAGDGVVLPREPTRELLRVIETSEWPADWETGKAMQRRLGLDVIPPRTESEVAAGQYARLIATVAPADTPADGGEGKDNG